MSASSENDPLVALGYDPVRELGRGGIGIVLLARQRSLDRLVALKRVHRSRAPDPDTSARLQREARALGRLDHPNIIRLYDVIETQGEIVLVMEYVAGRTVAALIAEGDLNGDQGARVVRDVADALAHAHERGVVHRDVKPANVIVDETGRAKLGDFGLARLLGDDGAFRTRPGTVMGTPAAMAPEQLMADADVSAPADVYALGVLAYEVLTGEGPFDESDATSITHAHLFAQPRDPVGLPSAVARVMTAALSKEPNSRPSAAAFRDAIDGVPAGSWPPVVREREVHAESPTRATDAGTLQATTPRPAPFATGGSSTAPPATPQHSEPPAWIEPNVYEPPRESSAQLRASWLPIVAATAVVIAVAAAVALHSTGSGLRVVSADVSVDPRSAACPAATFRFTATIHTNGKRGTVALHWTRPDGADTQTQRLQLSAGARTGTAELRYEVRGNDNATGRATLHVTQPAALVRSSPDFSYVCK